MLVPAKHARCGTLSSFARGSVVRFPPGRWSSAQAAFGVRFDAEAGGRTTQHVLLFQGFADRRNAPRCVAMRIDDQARFREEPVIGLGPAQLEANLHTPLDASARRELVWHRAEGFLAICSDGFRLVAPLMDAEDQAAAIDPQSWTADAAFDAASVADWITDWSLTIELSEGRAFAIAPTQWGTGVAHVR